MTKITIATFNCENFFMRYKFNAKVSEAKKNEALENGFILDKKLFERVQPVARELTAKAILASGADIIALQEVENLDTLKSFQKKFLKDYRFALLIDGNDPRLIDVALLSKIPFDTIVTHQYKTKPNSKRKVFSRDCLEVNFIIRHLS